ncbi:MAG: DNA-processing protein DprA [Lachnospira sp.]|nr:DNA-processing protein DprA [Lachnospira sp.]
MDDYYWFWVCNIPGIGMNKTKALIRSFKDAAAVYGATKARLEAVEGITDRDVAAIIDSRQDMFIYETVKEMERKGVNFVHMWHKDYPKKLYSIYDAPVALYYKGRLPDENIRSVAVVGARNCTPYGKHMAYELCKGFARLGWQVISGMALGIDTYAHKGCVEAGGYTCAVLGCGVDVCYPRSNIELYSDIIDTGCVLSEYAMGTPPHAGQFPVRNRIISGLADVVVVVEARAKSGSLITVDHALDQGKDVYAVPGRVGDALSEGCNWLLKIGASVITKPEDIENETEKKLVTDLQQKNKRIVENEFKENILSQSIKTDDDCEEEVFESTHFEKTLINSLATEKDMVYSVLDLLPKSLDIIIEETGLDIAVVSEQLLCLQLEGLAQEISKNCYCRM